LGVKSALDFAGALVGEAVGVADQVATVARTGAEYAKPYAEAAAPVVEGALREGVRAATPLVKGGLSELQRSGVNVDGALKTVSDAATSAAPIVKGGLGVAAAAASAISERDPATLSTILGLGVVAFLSLPLLLPLLAGALRGYKGDVAPAKALDLLTQADALMVDLRKPAEIEKGSPAMPKGRAANLIQVPFDGIAKSLRSSVVDASSLEAESTARIIASLRKASKARPTILLDSSSSQAAAVARKLSALGFSAVYVSEGGLDGWARSGLAVDRTSA